MVGAGPLKFWNLAFGNNSSRVFHGHEVKIAPCVPFTRQPHSVIKCPSSTSLGGLGPPLYQVNFTGGNAPRAGKSNLATSRRGYASGWISEASASTRIMAGAADLTAGSAFHNRSSFRARTAMLIVWQPMSPPEPLPKARQCRQAPGT